MSNLEDISGTEKFPDDFNPHIVGTNHLPYNIKATIAHIAEIIKTAKRPIQKVMLEMLDETDQRPAIAFKTSLEEGEEHFGSIEMNPNIFYCAVAKFLRDQGIEVVLVFSPGNVPKLDDRYFVASDLEHGDGITHALTCAGERFNKEVDPLIIKRVAQDLPDIIIIGNTHARFLAAAIPNNTLINVNDEASGDEAFYLLFKDFRARLHLVSEDE